MSKTPVFRYLIGDYLNIGTADEANYQLMSTFESIDESPNAQVAEKHYTSDKSMTKITTGYQTQFPITANLYKNEEVVEYLQAIGEEQKLGVETDYIRVRLYQPVKDKENTFYARKFRVGFEITNIAGAGGEIVSMEGNMNTVSDVVVGEFNTTTKTFTEAGSDK